MVILISIISLQGDFDSHKKKLKDFFPKSKITFVKKAIELSEDSNLIVLPGGESSVIGLLSELTGIRNKIINLHKNNVFIFSTCAGTILLSKNILNPGKTIGWGLLDITIERNFYGRQVDSEVLTIDLYNKKKTEGVFIRAPKIIKVGKNVEIKGSYKNDPVLVREKNILAATFHPELSVNNSIYDILKDLL